MDKYKETFNTWNNIASLYQEKFMALEVYNDSYDFICNAMDTPNAQLLDIGCGPGNITKYLLSKRPDFDVLGIDIAPNMVALARQNNPTARFAVMDTRHIHTLDTTYDGIIAGFCLPYLSQTECDEFITNAYHLLNNHGLIYISFVEGDPNTSDYKVGSGGRVYFYYHRLDDLISQLKRYNFGDIQIFKVPYKISDTAFDTHTIVVARKSNGL